MSEALRIWRAALGFHVRHFVSLLPVLPFLLLPVVSDALHSVLIAQDVHRGEIDTRRAVREALRVTAAVVGLKLSFELPALAWAAIPIYGVFQAIRHRLYWAMASNVVVFEGLRGAVARARCRELALGQHGGLALRTLVTVPALIGAALLVVWVLGATFVETGYSRGFFVLLASVVWFAIPGAAAANTFLYLQIAPAAEQTRDDVRVPSVAATPAAG